MEGSGRRSSTSEKGSGTRRSNKKYDEVRELSVAQCMASEHNVK